MSHRSQWAGALIAALFLATGCEPSPPAAPPEVRDAWLRPGSAGGTSAAYFTIANRDKAGTKLLSVSSDIGEASLHSSSTIDGIARMRSLDEVMIPGRSTLAFEPGGNHVMLMGLKRDLRAGERVVLRLRFGHGETVEVAATVGNAEGAAHGGH